MKANMGVHAGGVSQRSRMACAMLCAGLFAMNAVPFHREPWGPVLAPIAFHEQIRPARCRPAVIIVVFGVV